MNARQFCLILLTCVVATQSIDASETQKGTLTLEGDRITFQTQTESVTFPPMSLGAEVENLRVVKYEAKTRVSNQKETDISELTLANIEGLKIVLVNSKPLKVIRILKDQKWIWKLDP